MDKLKVLFVDDEEDMIHLISSAFDVDNCPFECTCVLSPQKALDLIRQDEYAAIVTDMQMPVMTGLELLAEVRKISPKTYRLILSGHFSEDDILHAINESSVFKFMTKPFDYKRFYEDICEVVDLYKTKRENETLNILLKEKNDELRELNDSLEHKVEERTKSIKELHDELHKTFWGVISVMADFTEMSNTQVGSHSKRVAFLAKELALTLGLKGQDVFNVELAAMLHDVGKVGIPQDITNKPKIELTQDEFNVLRTHPLRGEKILKKIPELVHVASFVRSHHERIDGTGYPDKSVNNEIPLGSKIIAVADSFDKILNSKSTLKRHTADSALVSIQKKMGTSFDEKVVNALKEYLLKETPLKDNELEIKPEEVDVGMKLSRDFRGSNGSLLMAKDTVVEEFHLKNLQFLLERKDLLEDVFIYRLTTAQESERETENLS